MNRIFKFRCWDSTDKEWLRPTVLEVVEGLEYNENNDDEDRLVNILDIRFDHSIITQFTGYKDSKGNDIYEGDILEMSLRFYINNIPIVGEVMFHEYDDGEDEYDDGEGYYTNRHCGWEVKLPNNKRDFTLPDVYEFSVVVGNIFENPTLISDRQEEIQKAVQQYNKDQKKKWQESIDGQIKQQLEGVVVAQCSGYYGANLLYYE